MKLRSTERPAVEITLTPLIDILFIVLMFLVMTATFSRRTFVRVDLPEAATGVPESADPNVVRVDVDAGGRIHLNGRAVGIVDLRRQLEGFALPEQMIVVLAADERTPHGQVVRIIDVVRQSSVPRLHLETVPLSSR
jgi:biopolymer transport protein ExbD